MNEVKNRLSNIDRLKMARSIKQKETEHRRDKRWKIFSWTSSLLIGSIAGAVAITSNSNETLPWVPHKLLLIIAILVLSAYSILWLKYNQDALIKAWKQIVEIDSKLELYQGIKPYNFQPEWYHHLVSYGNTIALLALTSILIIALS